MTRSFTIVAAVVVVVAASPARAQVPCVAVDDLDDRCERWVTTYDHPSGHVDFGVDQAVALAASPDGDRVFVAGHSNDASGVSDLVLVAVSAGTGAVLWSSRYGGPTGQVDRASQIAVSPDGSAVFVSGTIDGDLGPNQARAAVVAFDAETGAHRWASTSARGGEGGLDELRALAASPDGATVYATGATGPPGEFGLGPADYLTIAYDAATGSERWVATYDGDGGRSDRATAVAVGPDGGSVYVTGTSDGVGDPRDYDTDLATVAYDADTGSRRWVSRRDGGDLRNDGAVAVAVDGATSGVYVAGFVQEPGLSSSGYTNYAIATLALDAGTGAERWLATHRGPRGGINSATDVAVAGGRVVVSGHASGEQNDQDWDPVALAYDAASGALRWTATWPIPGATFEMAEDVAISGDASRAYVTGFSRLGGKQDVVTAAVDTADGTSAWTARWNASPAGVNYDLSGAVAATPSGVVVAGTTGDQAAALANIGRTDFNYRDIALLAYEG